MVKFNRDYDCEEISSAIKILEREKQKSNGNYNNQEVLEALQAVFCRKCYICENKKITSYQIEHLRAHKGDINLKFDWNNLFLACGHCNNIKLSKYDNILDCTKTDIDRIISFRIKGGDMIIESKIEIQPLDTTEEVLETVELLNKVYNGNTPEKTLESSNIKKELKEEVGKFMQFLEDYKGSKGIEKEDTKLLIKLQLNASSPFAAFKRWIIRDYFKNCKELYEYVIQEPLISN